jgi:hypothetical protein
MPNFNPWIDRYENDQRITNTKTTTTTVEKRNKFENHLSYVRTECQRTIKSNSHQHPNFLQRYQKIIEMLGWTLDRYGIIIQRNKIQQWKEQNLVIIKRIVEELIEKKKSARSNIIQSELRDEVAMYRLEEATIDEVLSAIHEFVIVNR